MSNLMTPMGDNITNTSLKTHLSIQVNTFISNSDFFILLFFQKQTLLQRLSSHIKKHKHSRHFSAFHVNINELKIPQITTPIYIQIMAFLCVDISAELWGQAQWQQEAKWWSSLLACMVNHFCSFRCQIWFSTCSLAWFLRPVWRIHLLSVVICLDVYWCRVPAQVQNNTACLMRTLFRLNMLILITSLVFFMQNCCFPIFVFKYGDVLLFSVLFHITLNIFGIC